ncbi:site-specific integrase [Ruegeria sp. HKCCD7221]|uniref:tyrosine-type recombinase/integrase n=1 Tax=Ruegeria sp. HKCCD7221 TaxID=2683009 RepID=UPI001489A9D2|nr:site-specific integrase [Ruegeria sp. HKCCD7221]
MTKITQAQRDREILAHIEAALNLNPRDGKRGPLRSTLEQARDILNAKARVELTDAEYRAVAPGGVLLDPNRSGLLMRHGKRTGRKWLYRTTDPTTTKQIEIAFGTFPDLSVSEARDVWNDLSTARNSGRHPNTVLKDRAGIDSKVSSLTMAELVRRYLMEYARSHKRPRSATEDERILTAYVLTHYADLPAEKFGPEQVEAIIQPFMDAGKTNTASKIVIVLRTVFKTATGKNKKLKTANATKTWLRPDLPDPTRAANVGHQNKTYVPTAADKEWVVTSLFPSLPKELCDLFRLKAMTFTRIQEVTHMRWAELDLKRATWTVPSDRAKNGKAHFILLPKQAMSILTARRDAQDSAGIETDYVFPQVKNPTQPRTINSAEAAFRKQRVKDNRAHGLTPHSMRHMAETWLAESKARQDVRDRMLNHTPNNGAGDTYNHATLNDEAKDWWQSHADHLDAIASENVVSLQDTRQDLVGA